MLKDDPGKLEVVGEDKGWGYMAVRENDHRWTDLDGNRSHICSKRIRPARK